MKFLLALSLSALAAATSISPPRYGGDGDYAGGRDKQACQNAGVIIDKYASILRNDSYLGKNPYQLAQQIIAPDYQDFSESVRSLLGEPLDGTPESKNRTDWISNIQRANNFKPPPYDGLKTKEILCAGNVVVWSWELTLVGSGRHPVSGIQKLYLDQNGQIYKSLFEFNSIAWAVDTLQISTYCPGGKLANGSGGPGGSSA